MLEVPAISPKEIEKMIRQVRSEERKTRHSDNPPVEWSVGWLWHLKVTAAVAVAQAGKAPTAAVQVSLLPPQQQQHPGYTLLQENGFCMQLYSQWR